MQNFIDQQKTGTIGAESAGRRTYDSRRYWRMSESITGHYLLEHGSGPGPGADEKPRPMTANFTAGAEVQETGVSGQSAD